MKTIYKGTIPDPTKPWFVGQQVECRFCKSVIEIEAGDKVIESISNVHKIIFACPECNKGITLEP